MPSQKIALVTGANRGIGKEIACQLSETGFRLIVAARDLARANAVVQDLKNESFAIGLDVSNEDSVKMAATEVAKKVDHLDVLVNNAGVIGNHDMLDFDMKEIYHVMKTNFFGPMLTSKYFMSLLSKSKDARIINISSGMGELGSLSNGGYAAYRLSKSSLNAFTILLAAELRQESIKVFSVCPGWVKTDMGGKDATLSVTEGADTAVWLSENKTAVSGRFYRNRKIIDWLSTRI